MSRAALRRAGILFSIMAALSLFTGCSTFDSRWNQSDQRGRWEGTWTSRTCGHSGRLRCIMVNQKGPVAYFKAWYGGLFTFEYRLPLRIDRREGDICYFHGEADLGWLAGGVYRYEGRVGAGTLTSTYACTGDHGVFELQRPPDPPP